MGDCMTSEHNELPDALSLTVHELVTPINVAQGYIRMLIKGQGGPISEEQKQMLENAEHSCVRIVALMEEMRELRRLESGKVALAQQPFDVAALLVELAGSMHEDRERGVQLELRGTDRPLEVIGDRVRIADALRALLRLVLREHTEGAVVVAECSAIDDGKPTAVVAVGEQATVPGLVRASATGALIDEWKHGTGFVLPIARRVVEAHGGALWSAPGDVAAKPRSGLALRIPLKAN